MAAMICIDLGTGSRHCGGTRSRGLCWVSIVLGVVSPMGPLAFAPFVLLPVWSVIVAALHGRPTAG